MDFNIFEIVQMVVDVLFVAAFVGVFRYYIPKLKEDHRKMQIMTAESRETTTDPALIAEWVKERDKCKKGSKKWIAYTRNLKAEGYEK